MVIHHLDCTHCLTEDLKHADLVVEIRGARLGFVEISQAMIRETQVDNEILEGVTLLDIARQCNTSIVWTRRSSSIANKTLESNLRTSLFWRRTGKSIDRGCRRYVCGWLFVFLS